MAVVKEIMVENVLELKTTMSPNCEGSHQVMNWNTKHNSVHNVVKLKNINIPLQQ